MKRTIKRAQKDGFTLIELLVVISIIALLVGILLPALGAARRSAQSAVCLGNLRSAGQAMATYTADNRDWLAGPNTSGANIGTGGTYKESSTAPTQNMDWISPTLGDSLGLAVNSNDRIQQIFNNNFKCPANSEIYDEQHSGGGGGSGDTLDVDPGGLNYSSYAAALGFHVRPEGEGGLQNVQGFKARYPAGYRPRIDMVGSGSGKVYAMDGARYVRGFDDVSFNNFEFQIQGGNFMLYGPVTPRGGDPYDFRNATTLEPEPELLRYAARHSASANFVFFDGHAEGLGGDEMLEYEKFFPRGTKCFTPNDIFDPNPPVSGEAIR